MKCTGLYQRVSQSDEVNSQCYKSAVSSDEIMAFGPFAFCLSLIVRIFDIILLRGSSAVWLCFENLCLCLGTGIHVQCYGLLWTLYDER